MKWKGKYHPLKWVIWILAVLFLFYEYFIRVTPSVITQELMQSFHIHAAGVGLLSAFYLYAYAAMQIPVGAMTDKFGARKLLTIACALCVIGGLLLGSAHNLFPAYLGRFLQGLGSSFGFISLIYVSMHWFSQNRWALLIGIGNSLGMLGSVFGQGPLRLAVDILSWRSVIYILSLVGLILGVLIFSIVRNEAQSAQAVKEEKAQQIGIWKSLWIVMKNYRSWLIALISGFYYSILLGFGALWGVPFLQTMYGLSGSVASFATSMVYLGFVCGGPFIGYFSDRLKSRKPLLIIFTLFTLFSMCPVLYIATLPVWAVFVLIFITGVFASGQLLTYVLAVELNPVEVKATSTGFVNAFVFIVGSILQPVMGEFLELWWDRKELHGIPIYSAYDYMVALTWIPILTTLAFLLLFFIREKKQLVSLK